MLNHETQTAFEIIIKDKKLILEWIKDALMFRCEDCARVWLSATRLRPKYNNIVPLKTDWYYNYLFQNK